MSQLRRLVLVRHGETVGNSSIRFHGISDVELSEEGRAQMREARWRLRDEVFDLAVSSPLRRAWEAARILVAGAPVQLDSGLREVNFGRWEGLTADEIQAKDPILFEDWQARARDFEYPAGERRAAFRERVDASIDRIFEAGAPNVLVTAHKGVIRIIAERILEVPLSDGEPSLGGIVSLSRASSGGWHIGRRGSNPEGLPGV